MKLRIVNFSVTPLAGGPWRLVHALRRNTEHDVRLVDLKRWGTYPQDVVFEEQPELAVELAERADIIQFHNYLDYESTEFRPIDFGALRRRGKAFLRQLRSDAPLIARHMGVPVERVVNCPIPSIAIAQYPERFYPAARVVPNVVPIGDPEYLPSAEPIEVDLLCTPSRPNGAWSDRWMTKGAPETAAVLERAARRAGCSMRMISRRPLAEVLAAKRRCRLLVDDLVTGSYHVSGLEAMALGKPAVTYLDTRIEAVLREVAGTSDVPFINARLEDAEEVLVELMRHPEALAEWGAHSRAWLDRYWSEAATVAHYERAYHDLLRDPTSIRRQESLRLDGEARRLVAFHVPDAVHRARRERHFRMGSRPVRAALRLREWYRRIHPSIRAGAPAGRGPLAAPAVRTTAAEARPPGPLAEADRPLGPAIRGDAR